MKKNLKIYKHVEKDTAYKFNEDIISKQFSFGKKSRWEKVLLNLCL